MSAIDHSVFHSPGYFIRAAMASWEKAGAARLRHRVFVEEQGLFPVHDRDKIDKDCTSLVALSTYAHEADEVVGTVRIHEEAPGLWWGSRLAVDSRFRHVGRLGRELIRLAVSTANGRGCRSFSAHVQAQNVPMFEALHWRVEEEIVLHGMPHARMRADLAAYPPITDPEAGFLALAKRSAPPPAIAW
ncbi:MSMEG_0567/Sll0786 family nitrogen starvation N-acetyltransferase [Jiella mangrovi]|uniref:GNAT family N-acetyltransferase n=1 Tax=Jiella mangrovi TaxID=2821407 RepID=A0ABS4BFZ3_9HYPH|nr:MSMEG_0567/Sll0786 family nitrogen starvation N-acetyltransferase [Jiella mangrovi]MBP0615671.1 GNAT family N-acetyltransferase [Jiella mangrovi]